LPPALRPGSPTESAANTPLASNAENANALNLVLMFPIFIFSILDVSNPHFSKPLAHASLLHNA
jgi:hypothetical protein